MRTHGAPPREPWEYDKAFDDEFRRTHEMRYALMPYLYAQARDSSRQGHPMLRTLFFEFPDDPTSWLVEDQYMLGSSLLVAPLFTEAPGRAVYLPPGTWTDYQTQRTYEGGRWHHVAAGQVPIVVMVREGSVLPHAAVAQHTGAMEWSAIELRVYPGGTTRGARPSAGLFSLPGGDLVALEVPAGARTLSKDPLAGRVTWRVESVQPRRSVGP
jgi:alpha-D-xyloside xylohydrolase